MKWFRRKPDEAVAAVLEREEAHTCPHVAILPRWDSIDDIGHDDRATFWECEACGEKFTPAEAAHLRETEAARLTHAI